MEQGKCGVEHAILPEKGIVVAGECIIGADSHTSVSYTHLDVYKRQSYDITIDGKYIYYLAKNDEQYALKRMTITGENIETPVSYTHLR